MGFLASGALGGISQFPATLSLTGKRVSEENCSHSGFCRFIDRGGGGRAVVGEPVRMLFHSASIPELASRQCSCMQFGSRQTSGHI